MQINKGGLIRRQVLDGCLSSNGNYTLLALMDKCNEALREHGLKTVSSENTIRTDLQQIQEQYPEASVISIRNGRNIFYRYKNKDFSIYKKPLTDTEILGLTQALSTLSRFEGMPGFEWLEKLIERFKPIINIDTSVGHVVSFDENIDLKGREYFSILLQSIVSRQVLLIRYFSYRTQHEFTAIIHPYYLKQYNNRWFLFGLNDERREISNLAFDRIREITPIPKTYITNESVDFFEFFDNMIGVSRSIGDTPQEVRLFVSQSQLPYILSKPLHGTQRIVEKNQFGAIISIKVILNYELEQMILGFGETVKVLSPNSLVHKICERLHSASAFYQ
ncbi:helix-turn-helix transcriptional regulator [Bacteroides sp. AN502(2024)]|uniref:helix-turn-helix transcriptional regulator n=1 Tax=Bacteroides sp. AN502(2024) TaxID=3160599 RepID=UPI0035197200